MEFNRLTQSPESERDELWEQEFLLGFQEAHVSTLNEGQTVAGPDGWPYLSVRTSGESSGEPALKIIRWLAGRGIGLVVNAHKMVPDYVFTYGMIWNFIETGGFITSVPSHQLQGDFKLNENSIVGQPTEKYLPPYVRSIVREFLVAQGFADVQILVVSDRLDFQNTDLVFALESLNSISAIDQKNLAGALSWFFPLHYRIVFAQAKSFSAWASL